MIPASYIRHTLIVFIAMSVAVTCIGLLLLGTAFLDWNW